MPFRWPFTFRRKRAILFKPVPGVHPRYAREFVCAPYCDFVQLWQYSYSHYEATPKGKRKAFLRSADAAFHIAMRNAYQSDAERGGMEPLDSHYQRFISGTGPAIPSPQDGNRAARTGGET
jgi:hypothetical protein